MKKWKVWKIMAVPKFKILQKQMRKCEFVWITFSNTRPLHTLQKARKNRFVNKQCSIWSSHFCFEKCIVSFYENNSHKLIQYFLRCSILINWASKTDDWLRNLFWSRWKYPRQSSDKIVVLFRTNLFQILIVSLSQVLVNSLIIFGCFWRNHLSKACEDSTIRVDFLCSAAV